jgi:signal transduction histidine kinase
VDPDELQAAQDRAEVMERRWRRERDARLESERIAEAGLRRLWDSKNELDSRVEERTRSLLVAHGEAAAAAAAKTEFLANLSHEVRTPLQTILSALELAEPVRAADRERLADAELATAELCDLFDNLLELAQCEVGSIELTSTLTELEQVADELVERWHVRLIARGLLLVPESHGVAEIDRVRLVQIGDALLQNATKFSQPGTVQLCLVRRDGAVHLVVTDDGPGVDPASLERMFEPFVQLGRSSDRPVAGAGVGLALVRGLSDQMGGTARAERTASGGLAVAVRIPVPPSTRADVR